MSDFTQISDFAQMSEFTKMSKFAQISYFTQISEFAQISDFTQMSDFTRDSASRSLGHFGPRMASNGPEMTPKLPKRARNCLIVLKVTSKTISTIILLLLWSF